MNEIGHCEDQQIETKVRKISDANSFFSGTSVIQLFN